MMRKKTSCIAFAAAAVILLSACGRSGAEAAAGAAEALKGAAEDAKEQGYM